MSDQPNKQTFWDRLDDVQAGMLDAGDARFVPMSHYIDREAGALWFITAEGTDLVEAVKAGPQAAHYIIADSSAKLYARVSGTASLSGDRDKLDEIWNFVASAWFEGDKADADLRLVKFSLSEAEVWMTDGGLKFLWEVAKANVVDGDKPDMGETGVIRFAD